MTVSLDGGCLDFKLNTTSWSSLCTLAVVDSAHSKKNKLSEFEFIYIIQIWSF